MLEIIVCDNEQVELNHTVNILHSIFREIHICYHLNVFHSAVDVLEAVIPADIAVLDIPMHGFNGIDLGKALKNQFPDIKLIYLTNYIQYCIQAVNETHPFSYLHKPVEKEILKNQIINLVKEIDRTDEMYHRIFYKVQNEQGNEIEGLKLNLKQILYFESVKRERRIMIVMADRIYKFPYIMEELARELKGYGFIVNCRGQLVNLAHIVRVKNYRIYLDTGSVLSLSQKRVTEFKTELNDFYTKTSGGRIQGIIL